MKNWKYINGAEVGNAIKNDEKAKKLWEEMQHAKKLAEDWAREINRTGDNSLKGSQKDAEEAYKKAKKAYDDYALNSRFGNSDGVARMFEGLVKDENKETEKDSGAIEELEKVGNAAFDDGAKKGKEDKRKGKLITLAGFEMHAPGYSNLSFKEKEEYRKGYYSTNDLKKEDIYKWGNSAPDDKFAYVMREFDEGKLKTPDGKVVTNPEQAKAIAYSESKKAENGLSRARMAMKV